MIEWFERLAENSKIDGSSMATVVGCIPLCYELTTWKGKSHAAGKRRACRLANPFRLPHSTDVESSSVTTQQRFSLSSSRRVEAHSDSSQTEDRHRA